MTTGRLITFPCASLLSLPRIRASGQSCASHGVLLLLRHTRQPSDLQVHKFFCSARGGGGFDLCSIFHPADHAEDQSLSHLQIHTERLRHDHFGGGTPVLGTWTRRPPGHDRLWPNGLWPILVFLCFGEMFRCCCCCCSCCVVVLCCCFVLLLCCVLWCGSGVVVCCCVVVWCGVVCCCVVVPNPQKTPKHCLGERAGPHLFWVWRCCGCGCCGCCWFGLPWTTFSRTPPPLDTPPRDHPKLRSFSSLSRHRFRSFCVSLGVFSLNFGGFEGRNPEMCTFGLSGCRVSGPNLLGPHFF